MFIACDVFSVAKDRDTDKLIEEKYVSEQSKYTVVRGNKMT